MKSIILAVSISVLTAIVSAIPAYSQRDSCCCALPYGDTIPGLGRRIPPFADLDPLLSPDGKNLAIISAESDSAFIVDVTTLARKAIIIQPGLPNAISGFLNITWCPYDTDLLAICVDLTDTALIDRGLHLYGNIYTYRLSTGECSRITPDILGPYGDTIGSLRLISWLRGSSTASDTLEITDQRVDDDSEEFYIPQLQKISRTNWNGRLQTVAQTRSESHFVMAQHEPRDGNYYFDDSPWSFLDSSIERLDWASFSPNEKLLALSVRPDGQGPPADSIFPQVWIYKMDSVNAPPIVINFQKSFCMYSFWGIDAEFVTDSTLAVSMHKDGDISSPLWEITLDGRIVRQLTFLPELPLKVERNIGLDEALHVFPNPTSDKLEILAGPSGEVHLFDLLGRERITTIDDGTGATLNVLHLEPGIYFLRIGRLSTAVEIAR
jgi:hypothetical protein